MEQNIDSSVVMCTCRFVCTQFAVPDIRYATAQRYFHDTKLQGITLNHMSTGLERFLKSVPMLGVKTLVYDEARVLTCLPRYGQRFNGFIMLKKLLV